ncbi:MAG: hypothetical protein ABI947_03635 [Chloroflexota bacterium]
MITRAHPLIELLGLIDMVWEQSSSGSLKQYSEQSLFKVYVVSLVKQFWSRRAVWRYLTATPLVAQACDTTSICRDGNRG